MNDISTLTDQELMNEIYKREISFICNIKFIFPKVGSKDNLIIEPTKKWNEIFFNGPCFDNTANLKPLKG